MGGRGRDPPRADEAVGTVVVRGDCAGADALAGEIAAELEVAVESMAKNAAARVRYGRVAWKGLNERMLLSGAELARAASVEVRVLAA